MGDALPIIAGAALVAVMGSGVMSLIAVILCAPNWAQVAELTGKTSLHGTARLTIALATIGVLGFCSAPTGLMFSALWCAAALLAASAEAIAIATGRPSPWGPLLAIGLWIQAAGSLTLGLLMAGSVADSLLTGVYPEGAGEPLYTHLVALWGIQFVAVGTCAVVSAFKIRRGGVDRNRERIYSHS